MKIRPLGMRVLVKPETQEAMDGGIYIPEAARESGQMGVVVACGTGAYDEKGKPIAFNVTNGDKVLMPKYGGTAITIEKEDYQIVQVDDILAVVD